MTKTYQQKVIEIFDDFINSLPSEVQENAERYFYPENEAINFKYEHFNLFSNFASYNIFFFITYGIWWTIWRKENVKGSCSGAWICLFTQKH